MRRYQMRERTRILRAIRWTRPEDATEHQLFRDALDAALDAFEGDQDALLGSLVLRIHELEERR